MEYTHDPDGTRLPVKLDTTTNGEFAPIPLEAVHLEANATALDRATANSKRLGLDRRSFLVSACGAASTFLAFNDAFASRGVRGGFYDIPKEASLDQHAARSAIDGNEFIFDVQGHFVNPTGAWLKRLAPGQRPFVDAFTRRASCEPHRGPGPYDNLNCIGPTQFVKDVFLDSDTDLMVLSFVPTTRQDEPLTIEEAVATAQIVERMEGTHRLLIHGRVNPNQPGDLESMEELASRHRIAAWKTYTQFGPGNKGFFMDDEPGLKMIEKARKLGVRNIAIHKGFPFGKESYEHSTCVDIGRVAKRFPDVNFLIYHSGFVGGQAEGPYDEKKTDGLDALVTSLLTNGVKPGSNVYAELGSTWRFNMRNPDSAAHILGKLLKYCGESNVLWGTDSVWYGSPQDQIQAFRTFQISPELRAKHGYPEMTPGLRAKIFGLNALKVYSIPDDVLKKHVKDRVALDRVEYRAERPDPTFLTHGPRNRRQFLALRSWGG